MSKPIDKHAFALLLSQHRSERLPSRSA